MKKTKDVKALRNYKDTVFRMLFREKENLLQLYNALNGTSYNDTKELDVVTLDNAVYMNVKNDVSFIFRSYMMLYEHQSTYSPNIPLRDLIYVSRQYEKYIVDSSIYSSNIVMIPAPKFVVFYNGTQERPEEMILNLSDAYEVKQSNPDLELRVRMININSGYNSKIVDSCRILYEYCQYVQCVRKYVEKMTITKAVENAVNECIKKNILADFLTKQRAEVIAMSILEYDEEVELKKLRATEYRFGKKEGELIGEQRGREMGKSYYLISLVCKKLKKQYTVKQIAEDLEITVDRAEELCKIAKQYSPEYDVDAICRNMEGQNAGLIRI